MTISRPYRPFREPTIQWNHVDGPMMNRQDGTVAWLNWKERFMLWTGRWDVFDVERNTYTRKIF